MMEKINKLSLGAVIVAVIAVVVAGVALSGANKAREFAGAFAAPGHNQFFTVDPTATSSVATSSPKPVQLMTTNTSRIYGLIVNDSDTVIYLTLKSFANVGAAASNMVLNEGIRLNANGGSYEILPENMYMGPIWATSSAPSKVILVTEK